MRRNERPHEIPWDYDYGIDWLERKLIRSLVFIYYSRCGRLYYQHHVLGLNGWLRLRHFDSCAGSDSHAEQQRKRSGGSGRSSDHRQHSEPEWMADVRWLRQRRRRRNSSGLRI
jgi:hypothetical protein